MVQSVSLTSNKDNSIEKIISEAIIDAGITKSL